MVIDLDELSEQARQVKSSRAAYERQEVYDFCCAVQGLIIDLRADRKKREKALQALADDAQELKMGYEK
jgi:hypothetical protein